MNNLQQYKFAIIMFKEVIVFIFIAVFLGLSQTAGVGGGPIVNISLMISMGYRTKLSIAVTYIFLIGGSIASVWKNSTKKNPYTNRSYVSLDLIMLTLPIMSSGSIFGSIIKNYVSQFIITIFFILLFLFLAYDLRKTIRRLQEASDASLIAIKEVQRSQGLLQNLIKSNQQIIPQSINNSKVRNVMYLCAGYYGFTVLLLMIKGGLNHGSWIGIESCGLGAWLLLLFHLSVSVFWSYRTAQQIIEQAHTSPNSSDRKVDINQQSVWYFIVVGFAAGIMGATLAIGGAIILIPVWLKLGVDKDVAASSTAPLILTAAMVAFTIALLNGNYQDISSLTMIFYLLLAFVSAAVVKDFISYLSIKYRLKALVVQLLLLVVIISLIVMVPFQLSKMYHHYQDFVQFGTFC